ncbi:CPCC family cysteine-rich protein [Streptomyces sp. NBRC 110028]|uniref:CPCC family cysteine-rich protein n=1 Tax=Streptomyces sp. NBRC 110028 TaxID=1621260 RepID=UPI00099F07C2|nr:CPCC family cysteine-rich protein [Streptomyces sp. NBRC 110028]
MERPAGHNESPLRSPTSVGRPRTVPTAAPAADYESCPVCFWEDDGQDDHDADEVRGGPNRGLSLTEARPNFHAMGACDERCI